MIDNLINNLKGNIFNCKNLLFTNNDNIVNNNNNSDRSYINNFHKDLKYEKKNINIIFNNIVKNKLNVLGIFDEFFLKNIENLYNITLCDYNINYEIPNNIDLLIVESCWKGNNCQFEGKIAHNKIIDSVILKIIKKCRIRDIPTIFINKEDNVNYDKFINTAKYFDYIFTTDINCIDQYKKDCPNIKGVFPFSFFINFKNVNPIGRKINEKINKNCLFAGSYYANKENRIKRMNEIFDELIKNNYNLNIIDRCYNRGTLNIFPEKYNKYLYKSLKYEELIKNVSKNYEIVINFNIVNNSKTMFARRIIEGLAQKNLIVSDYSPAIEEHFKGLIFEKEDIKKLEKLDFIERERIKHKGFIKVYEKFTDKYFYNYLLECLNISKLNKYKIERYNPKVSVICCSNRINNIDNILENYNRQIYENKELLVCINLDKNDIKKEEIEKLEKNKNTKVFIIDSKEFIGKCLNNLIENSEGEIIQKMDDDDYYGDKFIKNQIMMYDIYDCDIVSKKSYFVYFKNTGELYLRKKKNIDEEYIKFACGSCLSFKKKINIKFAEKNRGSDTDFYKKANENNYKILSSSIFDYIYIRDDCNKHTWNIKNKELIDLSRDYYINKYDNFNYNLIN